MRKLAAFSIAAILAAAADLSAQSCLGLPIEYGQFALGGQFDFDRDPGGRRYGGRIDANLPNPLAFGASFMIDDPDFFDETGLTFGGRGAFELPIPTSSICPILEVNYSSISAGLLPEVPPTAEFRTLAIPLLLGVGQRFDLGDGTYVVPAARAGVHHVRRWADIEGVESDTHSDNFVLVGGSVAVGRGIAFLSAGFTLTNEDGAPQRFHLGVGLSFP